MKPLLRTFMIFWLSLPGTSPQSNWIIFSTASRCVCVCAGGGDSGGGIVRVMLVLVRYV